MSALVAHALATSSMATLRVSALPESPPYSGGNGSAKRSCLRKRSTTSQGNSPVRSISAARGAMRSRAMSRTVSRIITCSWLRRTSTGVMLPSGRGSAVEQLPGDDHALDLVGALIYLARLGIAEAHCGGMILGGGLRRADVDGRLRHRDARVRRVELCDRGV